MSKLRIVKLTSLFMMIPFLLTAVLPVVAHVSDDTHVITQMAQEEPDTQTENRDMSVTIIMTIVGIVLLVVVMAVAIIASVGLGIVGLGAWQASSGGD